MNIFIQTIVEEVESNDDFYFDLHKDHHIIYNKKKNK